MWTAAQQRSLLALLRSDLKFCVCCLEYFRFFIAQCFKLSRLSHAFLPSSFYHFSDMFHDSQDFAFTGRLENVCLWLLYHVMLAHWLRLFIYWAPTMCRALYFCLVEVCNLRRELALKKTSPAMTEQSTELLGGQEEGVREVESPGPDCTDQSCTEWNPNLWLM